MGISLGLILYGRRVIQMMGSRVTRRMTSSMGFCVEWVAAVTVLIASLRDVAIPVSTTHCQIGGVVGAGLVRKDIYNICIGCPYKTNNISFTA